MKTLLFLDDVRVPSMVLHYDPVTAQKAPFKNNDIWDVVKDYNEFTKYILNYYNTNKKLPDLISFDHDLADEHYLALTQEEIDNMMTNEKTGLDCAKWLADFCMDNNLKLPECLCHSQNPAGRDNINMFLKNFKKFQEK